MFRTHRRTRSWLAPAAIALAVAASGCSDSTDPGDGDHNDPEGLLAQIAGVTVASVDADREVTGGFTVAAGAETNHIDVVFVDGDGEPIEIDESEFYLAAEVLDEAVAEVSQDTPGEFGIHVVGVAAGTTSLRLMLMHGQHPDGHADYTSPAIPVEVIASAD